MFTLGTIREFTTDNFTVIIDAVEDTDVDLSWDETGEVSAKIETGELVAFCARARVLLHLEDEDIELASDYLGGCVYESLDAFADHRACGRYNRELAAKGEAGRCGSYFADMISNVCVAARREFDALGGRLGSIHVRLM
jgi:hypothetical protein